MIFFKPFFFKDVHESNTYLIGCTQSRKAILVDAGGDCPEYDAFLVEHEASLTGIFLTHLHWDHDGALDSVLARYPVPVYSLPGSTPNGKVVKHGDHISLGALSTTVLQTTGHTPNSMSLLVANRFVFVGDALFAGSIGGTGNERQANEEKDLIRQHLFPLPNEVIVCPGHGPMTTIGIEKSSNPFFG